MMPQPPTLHRSLSKTLILTSALPLLLLSVIILYHLIVSYTREIKLKNQVLARAISGQVEAQLQTPLAVLSSIRFQIEFEQHAGAAHELQSVLNQHVESESFFDSIYLLSPQGLVTFVGLAKNRAHLREDFRQLNLSHLEFYRQALKSTQPVWSDTFHSLITSDTSLALCIPLQGQRALIGGINIGFLQTIIEKISHGENVETTILDHRGEVIASSDPHRKQQTTNLLHLPLIQQGLKGNPGNELYADKGVSHLGSVATINGPGWLTLVSQQTTSAYRPVLNAGMLFGLGLIGAILLSLIFALRKAHRLAKPFQDLSTHAGEIAAGSYDLAALPPSYREFDQLKENFQHMALAIRDREEALRLSERNYRTLAENLPAMVYRVARQDNNRLILLNDYFAQITGFEREELVSGGPALFASKIHLEDLVKSRQLINDAVANRQNYNVEYRFMHRDGSYRNFVEWGSPVFDEQGRLLYLDGVIFDNSEQQQARELFMQTEKMMSVGGLAAGMAHEINNPLAGILLNIELIRQRLSPRRDANREIAAACSVSLEKIIDYLRQSKVDQMFSAIDEAAKRTAKIVENVLSFSRKGSGSFTKTPVVAMIEQSLSLAEHSFDIRKGYDFKKITITREYREPLPDIPCEPSQIQQVLLNIFENGAAAMFTNPPDDYQPEFKIDVYQEGDQLCITISDNGPGMNEATRRRIFEPFFTTKDAGRGTGLGLSVSYFIICNNHQGSLWVDSTPDGGSTFSIRLPYSR